MKKMHVLFITRPAGGGMKEHIISLINGLDPQKFAIYVAGERDFIQNMNPVNKHITSIPVEIKGDCSPKSDVECIYSLIKLLFKNPFDVVHCHGLKAALLGGIAAGLTGYKNCIYTVHNDVSFDAGQRIKKKGYETAERFSSYFFRYIIAVSEGLKRELTSKRGIPEEKIKVIPNGIDVKRYKTSGNVNRIKEQMGIPKNSRVIGTIARFAPQKDLSTLLRAVSRLISLVPDVRFIMVGDGPLRPQLEKEAENLNIRDKVIFTGYRHDIPKILGIMDVFALSSRTEGMPITVLEAMVMEKAVVATGVGGIPEVVKHGVSGILVNPGDEAALAGGLLRVLNDKELAQALGSAGKKTILERYTVEKMLESTERLYLEIYKETKEKPQQKKKQDGG
ncbi:N-acetyl-alpha-D-glucosaminyl L-malate synthase [Koleobacter methoxysyntrophicus]|uniref:N-acetyl-alpha-D-glucosaminyl L-malate synthase n=1 Tax=Koleobacter methoxysyntrophicus TaxID=2751313 RepID=A0A8A0RLX2_9FIRM|nr:glycosyltransferase family 4 protein [Koleobacter methoxysyntrophicus]QSQ09405.1 N-acetyl-alpha-D-glucosaminyl L-malate synthase [Koleobacter methoxysyntrophicus]